MSGVFARHYSALEKEQKKGKPNPLVINKYLNEFASRRQLIQETAKDERPHIILELYPCFKHPNEVQLQKYIYTLSILLDSTLGFCAQSNLNQINERISRMLH
jgi:hypothetical protein